MVHSSCLLESQLELVHLRRIVRCSNFFGVGKREATDSLFLIYRRDAYSLNERRVYLTLLHTFVAVCAAAQHVLSGKSVVEFDEDSTVSSLWRLQVHDYNPRVCYPDFDTKSTEGKGVDEDDFGCKSCSILEWSFLDFVPFSPSSSPSFPSSLHHRWLGKVRPSHLSDKKTY